MNIAIYVKNTIDNTQIKTIKEYFLKQNYAANVFVANENIVQNNLMVDIATINTSNIHWFKETIVFTSIEDYLDNKENIIGQPVIVLNDKVLLSQLTEELIEKCELLLITNEKIRKVKNAELQSIVRQ